MRWADHVARVWEMTCKCNILGRNVKRIVQLGCLGVDGRTLSKWIPKKQGVKIWSE